jgi:maltose alpha-D-glucosyltransferase/alpha-amylase
LLSEANQSPADTAAYFGDADEFHLAFYFPLVAQLFLALRREDRQPLSDVLRHTPPIPDSCQWATFLRNHDEITLSRITPEDREFLFRAYAALPQARLNSGIRRRLAPLLENDPRQILLAHSLIFSLPGSPVLYYGDEIGMGDDLSLEDRFGLRTPMQWSSERNAGFSQADPERLYLPVVADPVYGYATVNVEAQRGIETSLFRQLQRLIAVRKRIRALSRGSFALLHPENQHVFIYLRQYGEETVLVANNLSCSQQTVTLELSQFHGTRPAALWGDGLLPTIGARPYRLDLEPYSFHWLRLERDVRA